MTLDRFDRPTVLDDPFNASNFTWSYGPTGAPLTAGLPNGNTTTFTYDAIGRETSRATTAGATNRVTHAATFNRAGQILSATETVTTGAAATTAYGYDPAGRLTGYTPPTGSAVTYGWDGVPNRTSVTTGGTPVTTTYDAANRPTSTGYGSDADGRLTARPTAGGQTFVWDDLGRLTAVKNAAGTVTLATYTYDPLDRLRLVDRGATDQVRFRYVGTTTSVAQVLDHDAGTISRNIATSPGGEPLADWTGAGSDLRIYGTNAHHDVTVTTGAAGTVTATARYDPWGTLAASSGTLPEFGFQGSWTDATTQLLWVVTRWYAPAQGRFISEDSLLGDPARPASRHLYAYGEGEPVGRWDPDGRFWYRVRFGESFRSIALRYLGSSGKWPTVWNANRNRTPSRSYLWPGVCIWVRVDPERSPSNQCQGIGAITGRYPDSETINAARTLNVDWYNLTYEQLVALTLRKVGRARDPSYLQKVVYARGALEFDVLAGLLILDSGGTVRRRVAGMRLVTGNGHLPANGFGAITVGHVVFMSNDNPNLIWDTALLSHEYIHTLQLESGGLITAGTYGLNWYILTMQGLEGSRALNENEAIGYLWEGWLRTFLKYGERPAWCYFKPLSGTTPSCASDS